MFGQCLFRQDLQNLMLTEGKVLRLTQPLRLWGGLDPVAGRISDADHPQHGQVITGRVVVMPPTAGSTSGPSVLAECLRRGAGPIGFVVEQADVTLLSALGVARSLYGSACFIHYLPQTSWPADGEWFSLPADIGGP